MVEKTKLPTDWHTKTNEEKIQWLDSLIYTHEMLQ